jgi:hypothetical protein
MHLQSFTLRGATVFALLTLAACSPAASGQSQEQLLALGQLRPHTAQADQAAARASETARSSAQKTRRSLSRKVAPARPAPSTSDRDDANPPALRPACKTALASLRSLISAQLAEERSEASSSSWTGMSTAAKAEEVAEWSVIQGAIRTAAADCLPDRIGPCMPRPLNEFEPADLTAGEVACLAIR